MNEISSIRAETLPTDWNVDREEPFFRIVADLFPTRFTVGASVLLASYDAEAVDRPSARATADPRRGTFASPGAGVLGADPRRC